MQCQHVRLGEKLSLVGGDLKTVGQRLIFGSVPSPDQHPHAKSTAVTGNDFSDFSVAPDAQGFALEHRAQAKVDRHGAVFQARLLPGAVLEVRDVLGNAAHGRHDQGPGQFGGGRGRASAFGDRNAPFGAGGHVNVLADLAGLNDQLELGQFFDQRPRHVRALTNQHHHVGVFEANRQLAYALDCVGVNLGRISVEFGGALQFANRVLVVIKYHNIHPDIVPVRQGTRPAADGARVRPGAAQCAWR